MLAMFHRQPLILPFCVVVVIAIADHTGLAGVWELQSPGTLAQQAPIILSGKIIKIDVGTAVTQERNVPRFLDCAHIRVDRVHKDALSDVDLEPRMLTAFMHSVDTTVPGSETDGGRKLSYSTSLDISYEVGTEGIRFLFLKEDGSFYINCHLQQRQLLAKEDEFVNSGIFKVRDQPTTKAEWIKQRKSELQRSKNKQARVGSK